ncbi:hypothetical protein LG200_05190 [Methylobacillus caricis]|uniref:hypothetical protein n=1 Tax=Methylobacillus caricis TaxID=1971611 RepID=UPI001D0013E3|nr:hypothetical protein [Methylobacillus caricis]MCB5187399.1 hypothetical protein [Methylobacillus caricis]
MSDIKFYKSNHPTLTAICVDILEKKKALHKVAVAFADQFGGIPVVLYSLHDYSVDGIKFEPANDSPLWTLPDRKYFNSQRPRATLKKATPAQREELKALNERWNSSFPTEKVSFEPLYKAMNTDWGHVFLLGMGFFYFEGTLYVNTGCTLNELMTEITVTEFRAAQALQTAEKSA